MALVTSWTIPRVGAAQSRAPEQMFFEDLPQVITVSRMPQSIAEAPGAVTLIDREMIRASGARTLPDLLRLVPGFYVAFKNGHFALVASHGYTDDYARRMQVLIDGRSVYTPYFVGGVDWMSLPITLEDIETIEVVRGTNSVAYGSNAFLGVVNITTRTALQSQGTRLEVGYGEKGINDRTLRFGVKGERVSARVTYGQRKDNGFDAVHDTHRTEVLNSRVDWSISRATDASFWVGGSRGTRQDGYDFLVDPPSVPNTFYPPHDFTTSTSFIQAKLRHSLAANNDLTVHYYHNQERGSDEWTAQFVPGFPERQNANRNATRDHLEVQHVFVPLDALRVSWGAEVRRDTLRSEFALGTSEKQHADLTRYFVNGEWRLHPQWIVNAGVMREHHSLSGTTTAPRLFVNYLPSRTHAFRAGYSRGYRTPTIFEDRGNWRTTVGPFLLDQLYLSTGQLRAERVDSREIGYVGNWRWLGGTVDVRAFEERFADWLCRIVRPLPPAIVELIPEQVAYDFANCQTQARKRGIELGAKIRPFKGTLIAAAWSYIDDTTDFKPGLGYSAPAGTTLSGVPGTPGGAAHANRNLFSPEHIGSVLIQQSLPYGIDVSAAWYHISARPSPSQLAALFIPTEDPKRSNRVDVRIAKTTPVGNKRAELALVGQNLGGASSELFDVQRFTRRWFMTLSVDM